MAIYGALYLQETLFAALKAQGHFGSFWNGVTPVPHERARATDVYGDLMVSRLVKGDANTRALWYSLAGFLPDVFVDIRFDKGSVRAEHIELFTRAVELAARAPGDLAVVLGDERPALRRIGGRTKLAKWAFDEWDVVPWSALGDYELVDSLPVDDEPDPAALPN